MSKGQRLADSLSKGISLERSAMQNLPRKQGYLLKQSSVLKKFKKRFFRTAGRYLYYYKDHTDESPIAVIALRHARVKGKGDCTFELGAISSTAREKGYVLRCSDIEDYNSWVYVLSILTGK